MKVPSPKDVQRIVRQIHEAYWPPETPSFVVESEVQRHSSNVRTVIDAIGLQGTVVDVGGGWGAFACACAAVGFKAVSIDDGGDAGFLNDDDPRHAMPAAFGVEFIIRDVARDGFDFEPETIDAFTCFDSIEHWHSSPKRAFHQMLEMLRPGGLFFLSVPNCNDFVKRIKVPLGIAEWSKFDLWYHEPVFRSHVREPSVRDLRRIAGDLGLTDVRIFGRNDSITLSSRAMVRVLGAPLARLLQLRPSLCSEIFLAGKRAA